MTDAQASGGELVAVAREMARKGGFFPTPGALVEEIRDRRLKILREEREREWRATPPGPRLVTSAASDGAYAPEGWTKGRDMGEVATYVQGLVARGHAGRDQGEMYVAAMLREERERAEAEARGERYALPRYGPSLVGGGTIGKHIRAALTAPGETR